MSEWSNLARVVYHRTYSRRDYGTPERWEDTIERVIGGNIRGKNVSEHEVQRLRYFLTERKASPAGRGLWFSGAPAHEKIGGAALVNCWFLTSDDFMAFVTAQDLLMLGGGVGMSVEHRFVSKLPRVKRGVRVVHQNTRDADFIVPDSREGWNELTHRILEAYFVTGRSFSFSTTCIRGAGEPIKGFGGVASGPLPLVQFAEKFAAILGAREGRTVRPIDAADMICSIGELVVSGNVRRSAIIILGDPWDKEYLRAKRWDLGVVPSQRSCANFSVVCDDIEDLHPSFWKTYEHGEPFGLVNREAIQTYGRMGDLRKDTAIGVNPCSEATLENHEACNLQELTLHRLAHVDEFVEAARLMHRWGKRVSMERIHHDACDAVLKRNRRIGTGVTGCLQSPLFTSAALDAAYLAIQDENRKYSQELGIPESIRTTVVKPSGTLSKVFDANGYEGIHAAYSRYFIQRIRVSATDPLVPLLAAAGHHIEPEYKLDGRFDPSTLVVDFYERAPEGRPVADEDWNTWRQLDVLQMAQRHWADQAVSVTVYYKREEIPQLKEWLGKNLSQLKAVSFLCHSDHGFRQAPKEAITGEQYERLSKDIKSIDPEALLGNDAGYGVDGAECAGGACPVR